MTSPIDRPCSFCAAEPGSPCNRPRGSKDGFHAARLNPAVRGASFSASKNLVESRARGARRGAAKKKAMAKKSEPRKGRVFSVWWYVAAGKWYYAKHFCFVVHRQSKRSPGVVLVSRRMVKSAVEHMRFRFPNERVRVVRVTVRVRA